MSIVLLSLVLAVFILIEAKAAHLPIPSKLCSPEFHHRMEELEARYDELHTPLPSFYNESKLLRVPGRDRSMLNNFFHTLVERKHAYRKPNILFFGGSVVAGSECNEEGHTFLSCAYPNRIGHLLDFLLTSDSTADPFDIVTTEQKEKEVIATNLAQGGTPTGSLLPVLGVMLSNLESPPDAIFMDFSANDLGTARMANATVDFGKVVTTEAMFRYLRSKYPTVPIIYLETFPRPENHFTYPARVMVAERYDAILISYRDAMGGEDHYLDPAVWKNKKNQLGFHPPYPIHRKIAYTTIRALFGLIRREECGKREHDEIDAPGVYNREEVEAKLISPMPEPIADQKQLDNYEVSDPKVMYIAKDSLKKAQSHLENEPRPRVISGNWTLYEDRPGKAGWISEKNGSVIEFDVTFGNRGKLVVGILVSYENVGNAVLYFPESHPEDGKAKLRGKHTAHTSITVPMYYHATSGFNLRHGLDWSHIGWGLQPGKSYKMRIETLSDEKFKILYVIST